MMNYLRWTDLEMKRFYKVFLIMMGIVLVVESVVLAFNIMQMKPHLMMGEKFSLYSIAENNLLFYIPILFAIAALCFYVFFTWYREWFGKNTFAYQLLLLPFNRMAVYYAKLTSLLLYILGSLVFQIAIYPLLNGIYQWLMPEANKADTQLLIWLNNDWILQTIIPLHYIEFFFFYGMGIMGVIAVTTMILLERSYRLKGIGYAVLYTAGYVLVMLLPAMINQFIPLYTNELIFGLIMTALIATVSSLALSHYLMNKKIWV